MFTGIDRQRHISKGGRTMGDGRPFSVKRSDKAVSSFFDSRGGQVQIRVMPVTTATNYRLRGTNTRRHGHRQVPEIPEVQQFRSTMAGTYEIPCLSLVQLPDKRLQRCVPRMCTSSDGNPAFSRSSCISICWRMLSSGTCLTWVRIAGSLRSLPGSCCWSSLSAHSWWVSQFLPSRFFPIFFTPEQFQCPWYRCPF